VESQQVQRQDGERSKICMVFVKTKMIMVSPAGSEMALPLLFISIVNLQ
jgi:hypothetical protein